MKPTHALVREPSKSYAKCISSHPLHHTLDISKARKQHSTYCKVLSELGLEVIHVPRDDSHPDSCFVEDNAVVHDGRALICRMAKESRRGEQLEVARILEDFMPIKWAEAPGTIEGGDVIHFPDRLICGLTQRTNRDGIVQMKDWLRVHVDIIEDTSIMHIKSYITSLGKGKVITTKKYFGHQAIEGLKKILVPEIEEFAADTLTIGDTVIMPAGYPRSYELVREEGYEVITLDISEIEKCDGAITCLSILF